MAYIGNVSGFDTVDTEQIKDAAVTAAKVAADVATQAELDTVSTVASAALPKAGGTMTGALIVSDTVTADGLVVDGGGYATVAAGSGRTYASTVHGLVLQGSGTSNDFLFLGSDGADTLKLANNGDISFYEDTGATPKLLWDASDERLNLTGSDYQLSIKQGSNQPWYLRGASDGSFAVHLNGTGDVLRADSDGIVTKPYQPAFQSNPYGGQIGTNVVHSLAQTAQFNGGGHYNSSNGRFTAPVAGYYFFHMTCTTTSSLTSPSIYFTKSGSGTYGYALTYNQAYGNAATHVTIYLAENDYVNAVINSWNGVNSNIWNATWGGHLIG